MVFSIVVSMMFPCFPRGETRRKGNLGKRCLRKAVSDTIAGVKGFKPPAAAEDEPDPRQLLIKGLAPEMDSWLEMAGAVEDSAGLH